MLLSVERPNCGSLCLLMTKGHAAVLYWSGASSPAGVGLEHVQTDDWGSPGTWEIPLLPRQHPDGDTGLSTPGLVGALVRQGANRTSATEVSPSEGNEVRRDGQQEVVAPSYYWWSRGTGPAGPGGGKEKPKGGAWCWNLGREIRSRLRTRNHVST